MMLGYFSCLLNPDIEKQEQESLGFCKDVARNLKDIGVALCIPEIHRTLLYIVIGGITGPSFGAFSYYFITDVLKIS